MSVWRLASICATLRFFPPLPIARPFSSGSTVTVACFLPPFSEKVTDETLYWWKILRRNTSGSGSNSTMSTGFSKSSLSFWSERAWGPSARWSWPLSTTKTTRSSSFTKSLGLACVTRSKSANARMSASVMVRSSAGIGAPTARAASRDLEDVRLAGLHDRERRDREGLPADRSEVEVRPFELVELRAAAREGLPVALGAVLRDDDELGLLGSDGLLRLRVAEAPLAGR